jgi:hypothetical protein
LEAGSSGLRIIKILELIGSCRYGIHDISMQSLDAVTNLPRFNMPFELGLFLGCQHFSEHADQKSKAMLVLDSAPYRFRESLSDFAGYDIVCHNSSPDQAIRLVRDWLRNSIGKKMYGSTRLQAEFLQFEKKLPDMAEEFAPHPDQINFTDLCPLIGEWIREAYGVRTSG